MNDINSLSHTIISFPHSFLFRGFPQENPAENISDRIGMDKI